MTEHTRTLGNGVFAALTRKRGHMIADNYSNPRQPNSSLWKRSSDVDSQSSIIKNDSGKMMPCDAAAHAAQASNVFRRSAECWQEYRLIPNTGTYFCV